jgi:hypothetical protein
MPALRNKNTVNMATRLQKNSTRQIALKWLKEYNEINYIVLIIC